MRYRLPPRASGEQPVQHPVGHSRGGARPVVEPKIVPIGRWRLRTHRRSTGSPSGETGSPCHRQSPAARSLHPPPFPRPSGSAMQHRNRYRRRYDAGPAVAANRGKREVEAGKEIRMTALFGAPLHRGGRNPTHRPSDSTTRVGPIPVTPQFPPL